MTRTVRCELPVDEHSCILAANHPGICRRKPTVAEILAFEAAHPGIGGNKHELITTQFGVRVVRYYQLLVDAVHTEEALTLDPTTTRRVLRTLGHRQHTPPTE